MKKKKLKDIIKKLEITQEYNLREINRTAEVNSRLSNTEWIKDSTIGKLQEEYRKALELIEAIERINHLDTLSSYYSQGIQMQIDNFKKGIQK